MVCRPALRFSHLARLSRSAGSRFSHGLPTSPAFPALGKAFAERREQIFAWSADQPCVFRVLSMVHNTLTQLCAKLFPYTAKGTKVWCRSPQLPQQFHREFMRAHRLNNSASRKRKATIFELYFYAKHWLSHQRFDTIETQRSTKCQKNLLQILKTN